MRVGEIMTNTANLDFYRQQSCFTELGQHSELFSDLPSDVSELCRIVRGLYIHYRSGQLPDESKPRLEEVNARYLSRILDNVIALDNRKLEIQRPIQKRFIGCCRDASLLLCSMLRSKGIPARIRVGFATYIPSREPFLYTDHVVTEYWNDSSQSWHMVDAEQDEQLIIKNKINFDVQNIPRDKFITGAKAWQIGRENEDLWNTFGIDDFIKGRWFVASYIMRDFAALNRDEILLWDSWGLMKSMDNLSDDDLALLDKVASLTASPQVDVETIQTLYKAEPRLQLSENVTTYSPVSEWRDEQINCF